MKYYVAETDYIDAFTAGNSYTPTEGDLVSILRKDGSCISLIARKSTTQPDNRCSECDMPRGLEGNPYRRLCLYIKCRCKRPIVFIHPERLLEDL